MAPPLGTHVLATQNFSYENLALDGHFDGSMRIPFTQIMAETGRHSKRNKVEPDLRIRVEHIPAPDVQERLARTFLLILQAAARADGDVAQREGTGEGGDEGGGARDVQSK